ncbi:hypothetical protein HYPSUDRAFT_46274 [Hypholoma sublateritium FD-334 SS-4]|uniref:Uncharacterized protein n=1 Tax=Hypholoma sublateritium (strain FD-334 SS-4) TaxID=945553 RepID=A0A0D2M2U5_HYPSF|nr:hypothetical protein HYPSUDRAFT_46274 [Hypholoma sublateritium FD-334 SS-4]
MHITNSLHGDTEDDDVVPTPLSPSGTLFYAEDCLMYVDVSAALNYSESHTIAASPVRAPRMRSDNVELPALRDSSGCRETDRLGVLNARHDMYVHAPHPRSTSHHHRRPLASYGAKANATSMPCPHPPKR